jgi:hypothetical protein
MKGLRSALRWHRESAESIVAASDYAFTLEQWLIGGPLFILGIVSVVGLPAIFGYLHRCIQVSVKCCAAPPRFDRLLADYVEGLKIFFLGIYYFLVIVIGLGYLFSNVALPVSPASTGQVGNDMGLFMYYGSFVVLLMFILFALFFMNAWLRYATKGDYLASLNPLFVIEWTLRYPTIILNNFIQCSAIMLIAAVACVFVVTIPWAVLSGLVACACVSARSYVRDTEKGDPIVDWVLKVFRAKVPHDHPLLSPGFDEEWQQKKEFYAVWRTGVRVPGWLVEYPQFYLLSRLSHTLRSIRYALANGHRVFWGGLVALSSGVLIGTPLLFGYLSRCLRESLHGSEVLPPFDGKVKMYLEGLVVGVMSLEYLALTWLLFQVISPLFNVPALSGIYINLFGRWTITNVHVLLPAALHAFVFGMFFNNAWLRYAITGKMLQAMNPVSMAGWMLTYPEIILNNMMSTGLLGLMLLLPGFLVFTLPWVTFVGLVANAFIRGESFEKLTATGGIRKSPVVKGLVKTVTPRAIRK